MAKTTLEILKEKAAHAAASPWPIGKASPVSPAAIKEDERTLDAWIVDALEAVNGNEANRITTGNLAQAMIDLGFVADRAALGIAICKKGHEYMPSLGKHVRVNMDGTRDVFVGGQWIGSAMTPHEPWNRHQWYLPLWERTA